MQVDAPAATSSKKGTDLVALEAEIGVHLQAAAEARGLRARRPVGRNP